MKLKLGKNLVEITHEDKILFPKSKITKKMLAEYYLLVAPLMLPLIEDRPISMKRYPKGIQEDGFFQKNVAEGAPSWVKTVRAKRKEQEDIHMVICNDKATLLWLVNQNCITPHIWLSRYDKARIPDRIIFDLDPPKSADFSDVVYCAKSLREILEDKFKLTAFVNTTGSKGLHVIVPIKRELPFDKVRAFAKKIALYLVEQNPKKFTNEVRKEKRGKKVYIDILRNAYGQTAVAPYAVRALEGAPVAVPLFWEELNNSRLSSNSFNIKNIEKRLKLQKKNPWESLNKSAGSIQKVYSMDIS